MGYGAACRTAPSVRHAPGRRMGAIDCPGTFPRPAWDRACASRDRGHDPGPGMPRTVDRAHPTARGVPHGGGRSQVYFKETEPVKVASRYLHEKIGA
ncbi:hypothetical protein E2562_011425 [Oryza meyeriana var. granulata]|uniref:Uncharacterized protein n=1 Tax=Oryza meyeriana var. granulata TaxID=110450 RepID=A0A6G1D269_9ORYZ|nr:hypothetical protein E2562_011425 [Oryza meyeriana var. granulata]